MSAPSSPLSLRVRGLTLIELIVALVIFSILGVMSYRALSEIGMSQTRLDDDYARWRAISRCLQRIDADLLQVVAPFAGADGRPESGLALLAGAGGSPELQLLRIDGSRGVRRVAFRLAGDRLDGLRWNGREAVGEAQSEVLLAGVRGLRWSFLHDGKRVDSWPAAAESPDVLPDAVILELDLADVGKLTRIVALR